MFYKTSHMNARTEKKIKMSPYLHKKKIVLLTFIENGVRGSCLYKGDNIKTL